MLDLNHCRIEASKEIPIVPAYTVVEEGLALISIISGGVEKVRLSAGAGVGRFAGFSYGETLTPITKSYVETRTIPAASTYTITLAKNNLVASNIFVYDNTDGAAMAEDTLANGKFECVDATGILTFHSSDAGHSVTITYRYTPTATELTAEDKLLFTAQSANEVLSSVGVIMAGEVFTDKFDAAVDWSTATDIEAGTSGIVTAGGSTIDIPNCKVIYVPTADYPFLGLRFTTI